MENKQDENNSKFLNKIGNKLADEDESGNNNLSANKVILNVNLGTCGIRSFE
jgi:hypothetical protein